MVEKPVSPMDGLRVECVGNRHDNSSHVEAMLMSLLILIVIFFF